VDKAGKKVLGECFPKFQLTAGSAVTECTSVHRGPLVAHTVIASHMDANYTKIRDTGDNPNHDWSVEGRHHNGCPKHLCDRG
jgi:hypothetical protein